MIRKYTTKKGKLSQQRSLGDMISTAVFAGMACWLLLEAASLAPTHPKWQVIGLLICAALCALASMRYVIDRLWRNIQKYRK